MLAIGLEHRGRTQHFLRLHSSDTAVHKHNTCVNKDFVLTNVSCVGLRAGMTENREKVVARLNDLKVRARRAASGRLGN